MSQGILLHGLDGSNPLAFLAALGTLRTLTLALPNEKVRMSWESSAGAWRPRVFCSLDHDGEALVARLDRILVKTRRDHPTAFIDDTSSNADAARYFAAVRAGGEVDTEQSLWITSLTNDIHPDATSPLQIARKDYFSGNLDQVIANTTPDHLRRSLLLPWFYDDPMTNQSLHLDPSDDRRHAYQWNKPNGDKTRNKTGNMLGANRLAIESFPMFLGIPSSEPTRLWLTGWTGVHSDDAAWTWPIWDSPISLDVVKALLALDQLQTEHPPVKVLVASGVCRAFRCRRILYKKTPNLTPTRVVV